VVKLFANHSEGALLFSQSTLSHCLAQNGQEEDQQCLFSNSSALSGKRTQIVTQSDVEKALILWAKHMEEKLEHMTSAMLVAKQGKFEDLMDLPEEETLCSDGWVQKFYQVEASLHNNCDLIVTISFSYNLKEYKRHSEAASADLDAAKEERKWVSEILAPYAKRQVEH
jgi:hypothetical protein